MIAQRHEVHPEQVSQWKQEVAERLTEVVSKPSAQVEYENLDMMKVIGRGVSDVSVSEIFNTDQGCQFTSVEFTQPLLDGGVQLSMDGKGR